MTPTPPQPAGRGRGRAAVGGAPRRLGRNRTRVRRHRRRRRGERPPPRQPPGAARRLLGPGLRQAGDRRTSRRSTTSRSSSTTTRPGRCSPRSRPRRTTRSGACSGSTARPPSPGSTPQHLLLRGYEPNGQLELPRPPGRPEGQELRPDRGHPRRGDGLQLRQGAEPAERLGVAPLRRSGRARSG